MDAKAVVREAYNIIAERYVEWVNNRPNLHEEKLSLVLDKVDKSSRVLDLGCGAGVPIARRLSSAVEEVVGIDISDKQVELAKRNVPNGKFILGDMASIDFEKSSFDAVVSFYAIFHLPREEQPSLLAKVNSWLKPGGLLLLTLSTEPLEANNAVFHGAKNFFSSWDDKENEKLVRDAGFEILSVEVRAQGDVDDPNDPDNGVSFLWIFAQKPT